MKSRGSFWTLAMTATAITVVSLNVLLIAEVHEHRSKAGAAAIDATLPSSLEQPEYTTYLLFSPAQCSSHFVARLEEWQKVFDRFHGSNVWVQPVAVYTSRAELGRLWDALGYKLAVHVDPEGSILRQFGIQEVPAKIVVDRQGRILYQEVFPELYEEEQLVGVLERLLDQSPS